MSCMDTFSSFLLSQGKKGKNCMPYISTAMVALQLFVHWNNANFLPIYFLFLAVDVESPMSPDVWMSGSLDVWIFRSLCAWTSGCLYVHVSKNSELVTVT